MFIYYTHNITYVYIYIYVCVRVCVCVCEILYCFPLRQPHLVNESLLQLPWSMFSSVLRWRANVYRDPQQEEWSSRNRFTAEHSGERFPFCVSGAHWSQKKTGWPDVPLIVENILYIRHTVNTTSLIIHVLTEKIYRLQICSGSEKSWRREEASQRRDANWLREVFSTPSLVPSVLHSFNPLFLHSFTCSVVHSFVCSPSIAHSPLHPFIHSPATRSKTMIWRLPAGDV